MVRTLPSVTTPSGTPLSKIGKPVSPLSATTPSPEIRRPLPPPSFTSEGVAKVKAQLLLEVQNFVNEHPVLSGVHPVDLLCRVDGLYANSMSHVYTNLQLRLPLLHQKRTRQQAKALLAKVWAAAQKFTGNARRALTPSAPKSLPGTQGAP